MKKRYTVSLEEEAYGEVLKQLRAAKGKSQEKIATDASTMSGPTFTRSIICELETGKRTLTPDYLFALCTYYNITPDDFHELVNAKILNLTQRKLMLESQRTSAMSDESQSNARTNHQGGIASTMRKATVCLKHRINARQSHYLSAFKSGKDVLYVTIMSNTTLREDMENLLKMAQDTNTHIRVLTWNPGSHDAIEVFRKHLCENRTEPEKTRYQVESAIASWRKIEEAFPGTISVRHYSSAPTMQATIVDNEWALVELLPYATKPADRPALVLTRDEDLELFTLFRDRFEQLWNDNSPESSDS